MARVPNTTSDDTINMLWALTAEVPMTDDEKIEQLFDGELKRAEAVRAAINRLDRIMHQRPAIDLRSRTYDLECRVNPSAPAHERYTCIDLNTYDGSPDAEAPCTFIGRGASEKEARMALLDQFSAFDGEEPRPRPPTRTIFSSPFEPPEYADDVTRNHDHDEDGFDSDLDGSGNAD